MKTEERAGQDPAAEKGVHSDVTTDEAPATGAPREESQALRLTDDDTVERLRETAASVASGEPDVMLDVRDVIVELIELDVENLRAQVALDAEVARLVKLTVGADVRIGRVRLTIKGVHAAVTLNVRLARVYAILHRAMTTIDRNPQIFEPLLRPIGHVVEEVGTGLAKTLPAVGSGIGYAVGEVGSGIGRTLPLVGSGIAQTAPVLGGAVSQTLPPLGSGFVRAAGDVGGGVGAVEAPAASGRAPEAAAAKAPLMGNVLGHVHSALVSPRSVLRAARASSGGSRLRRLLSRGA